ncbi:MAG: hypothetical protein LBS01_08055 [Prevotellaceae bacterium]|nr:hypothetical protein [Prevotellaceae bacterium]
MNVLSSESRDKADIERKRNQCFGYAESRKTTKFIELCAAFVSFVVNFSTTRHTKKFTKDTR